LKKRDRRSQSLRVSESQSQKRNFFEMLKRILLAIIILVGLGLADWIISRALGPDSYYLQIVIEVGIAIILAVSLNLINGFTGQFSLGHAGFAAVGAYASAAITFYFGAKLVDMVAGLGVGPAVAKPLVFIGVLMVAGIAAAIAGLLVGLPTLRLRGDYLAIATLGFSEIIRLIINNRPEIGGAAGFTPLVALPKFVSFFWVYLFVIITIVVSANLLRSVHGRALLSIREDELASQVMGVPITYYKVMAFVLGAVFAGFAGCLTAHQNLALHPNDFDLIASVMIVVMVVLGGMGSITGCALAAVLLTLLSYALRSTEGLIGGCLLIGLAIISLALAGRRMRSYQKSILSAALLMGIYLLLKASQLLLEQRLAELRMLLFSFLLIMLMLTRPQGLFGAREFSLARLLEYLRPLLRRQTHGPA